MPLSLSSLRRPRSGSAPPRTSPASLGGRAFRWVRGYRRAASWERALGESSAPHGSTSPGEKAFRRIRGISKNSPTAQTALWERPAPHEPRFPWRKDVLLGSDDIHGVRSGKITRTARPHFPWRESVSSNSKDAQKARVGNGPRCMILLNGSGRKLMAHA